VNSARFNDLTIQRFNAVLASPAQSNLVQPNPAIPPPPGKETGKEMVKFLAIFDHKRNACQTSPMTPNLHAEKKT
jgi:hypothetical protein